MRIAVGIATTGRPQILKEALIEIAHQTRLPDKVVICPAADSDVAHERLATLPVPVTCVSGPRGSSCQRNVILDALVDYDLVVFFDDDYFPASDFLAEAEGLFETNPNIVVARGTLIADGINGPGITVEEGRQLLRSAVRPSATEVKEVYGAYGCNFAVRLSPVREHRVRFDEELPLYGWQEDIDFSRQLAPHGQIVNSNHLRGVHLGVKSGRTSGLRFGYSQIANPIYLLRKGTISASFAVKLMFRNLLANLFRAPFPEPWIDRPGRLKGNGKALYDLFRGRLHPMRIMDFE